MATAAVTTRPEREFRLTMAGMMARTGFAVLLVMLVFLIPLGLSGTWQRYIAQMAIFGVIGLSINILTGYAGQLSLGHQAFVGIGAFTSAYVVGPHIGAGFAVALVAAGVAGAATAFVLGLVALRIRGLYLALVTLSFGLMAQSTIFHIRAFTGSGGGALAPRPTLFKSDLTYAYLCILVLGFFIFVDWRLANSRAGRGIVAVRNNEQGAATLGINVVGYKLLAFVVSGFLAGIAGSLYAHLVTSAYYQDYDFPPTAPASPLIFLMMAVVGGLGSRAGVIIGSAFFAVFPLILPSNSLEVPGFLQFIGVKTVILNVSLTPLIGAFLLLLTVTRYPGGIGQQLLPIRRWMAGGPFLERGRLHRRTAVGAAPEEAVAATAETETVAFPQAPSEEEREATAVLDVDEAENESAEVPAVAPPPDGHEREKAGRIGRLFGFRRARRKGG